MLTLKSFNKTVIRQIKVKITKTRIVRPMNPLNTFEGVQIFTNPIIESYHHIQQQQNISNNINLNAGSTFPNELLCRNSLS